MLAMTSRPPTLDYRRIASADRRRTASWRGVAVVAAIIAIAALFKLALLFVVTR
jgi:hypothetical protein